MNLLLEAHGPRIAGRTPWVVGAEQRVPVLDGTLRRYVNLDNAASTPALREVMETVGEFMHWYASVHRGAGFKSRVATQAYEDARRIALDFVGADLLRERDGREEPEAGLPPVHEPFAIVHFEVELLQQHAAGRCLLVVVAGRARRVQL